MDNNNNPNKVSDPQFLRNPDGSFVRQSRNNGQAFTPSERSRDIGTWPPYTVPADAIDQTPDVIDSDNEEIQNIGQKANSLYVNNVPRPSNGNSVDGVRRVDASSIMKDSSMKSNSDILMQGSAQALNTQKDINLSTVSTPATQTNSKFSMFDENDLMSNNVPRTVASRSMGNLLGKVLGGIFLSLAILSGLGYYLINKSVGSQITKYKTATTINSVNNNLKQLTEDLSATAPDQTKLVEDLDKLVNSAKTQISISGNAVAQKLGKFKSLSALVKDENTLNTKILENYNQFKIYAEYDSTIESTLKSIVPPTDPGGTDPAPLMTKLDVVIKACTDGISALGETDKAPSEYQAVNASLQNILKNNCIAAYTNAKTTLTGQKTLTNDLKKPVDTANSDLAKALLTVTTSTEWSNAKQVSKTKSSEFKNLLSTSDSLKARLLKL